LLSAAQQRRAPGTGPLRAVLTMFPVASYSPSLSAAYL